MKKLFVIFTLSLCLNLHAQTIDDVRRLLDESHELIDGKQDVDKGLELVKQAEEICEAIEGDNSLWMAMCRYLESAACYYKYNFHIGSQVAEKAWIVFRDSMGYNSQMARNALDVYGGCAVTDSINERYKTRNHNIYRLADPVKRAIGQPDQGLYYYDDKDFKMLFPCVYDVVNVDSTGRLAYGCDKNGIHILDIHQRRLLFSLPVKSRHWNYSISAIGTKDDLYAVQVDKYLCDINGNVLDSASSGYKFIPFSEDSLDVISGREKYSIHKKDIAHYNRLHVVMEKSANLLSPEIVNLRYVDGMGGGVCKLSSEDGSHYGLLQVSQGITMVVPPIYDDVDKILWRNNDDERISDSPFLIAIRDDETILYDSKKQKATTFNKKYSFDYYLCSHKNQHWFMMSSDDYKKVIVNTNGVVYELPLLSHFEYNEEKRHYIFVDGIRQESYSTSNVSSFIDLILSETNQDHIEPVVLKASNPQIPDSDYSITIKCEYPEDDSPLCKSVRSWISDEVNLCFTLFCLDDDSYEAASDLSPNGMYTYYQEQLRKCGIPDWTDLPLETGYGEIQIKKVAQSSEITTYRSELLSAGEEGFSAFKFTSFNRSDGQFVTIDQVILPDKIEYVKQLLDRHILHETEVFAGNEEDETDSFPDAINSNFGLLPEGLVFCYQPYDLTREYSAGYYLALLTYQELEGCLTDFATKALEYSTPKARGTYIKDGVNPYDLPGYRLVRMKETSDSLARIGDFIQALSVEKQYYDGIFKQSGYCINAEKSLKRQLHYYESLGNDTACVVTAEKILQSNKSCNNYRILARYKYKTGHAQDALMAIQEAKQLIEYEDDPLILLVDCETATYLNACGNVQEAVRLARIVTKDFQTMTREAEFYDPTEQINWLTNQLPGIALASNDDSLKIRSYDAALLSKNRKLATDIAISQIILNSGDPVAINIYNTFIALKKELNIQLQRGARREDQDRIEELKDSITNTEGALKSLSSFYGDYTRSLTISSKDVRHYLTPQEVAIEFLSIDNQRDKELIAAILKPGDEVPVLIPLCKESQLPSSIDSIYQYIWKPIESYFNDIPTIYFSPVGRLHNVPIEYATTPSGRTLFEKKSIFRLSSTREIVLQRERKPDKGERSSAILYGGLDYDQDVHQKSACQSVAFRSVFSKDKVSRAAIDGFDYLPGTKKEVNDIKDLLTCQKYYHKVDAYTDSLGTEGSFKQLSGQDISVLHIATHGFYVPENSGNSFGGDMRVVAASKTTTGINDRELLRSGLMLAGANKALNGESNDDEEDGILTSLEVASMNLTGLDLVVLSACETAKGDVTSDGVFGLQRGFKKAGAHVLLLSLEEVEDTATQLLMTEFYRNLTNGQSKRESFLNAQRFLRQYDNGQYDKPEYWATFIMLDGIE